MRVAICEDDQNYGAHVRRLVEEYGRARPELDLEAVSFHSGKALLQAVEGGLTCALFLLDILMPELSGIQLAQRLGELRVCAPVVFLTSSPEYALDAFRVRAHNYLMKPVERQDLFDTLDDALAGRVRPRPVIIGAEEGDTAVALERILYAECNVHRVRYHLTNGQSLLSRTLRVPFPQAVRPLLESSRFLHPHRSYVVNVDHVLQLTGGSFVMAGGAIVPISQLRLPEMKKRYMALMLE